MIETKRLLLRYFKPGDSVPFFNMNSDPGVMEFFPHTLTKRQSDSFIKKIERSFKTEGFGLWALEIKETGTFIGFTGFFQADFEAFFTPCVEIGWRLAKEYWGQGYAYEAAKRVMAYGFNDLGLEEIYSFTSEINRKSSRLMKKLGLKFIRTFNHPKIDPASPLNRHVVYKITEEMYRSITPI